MRRRRGLFRFVAAIVFAATALGSIPGITLAVETPTFRLAPTATGGSKSIFFDEIVPTCEPSVKYDLQISIAYGKVTTNSVYLKNVTYYYWVKTGVILAGRFLYTPIGGATVGLNADWPTFYDYPHSYGHHYTIYLNKTFAIAKNAGTFMMDKWIYPQSDDSCAQDMVAFIATP